MTTTFSAEHKARVAAFAARAQAVGTNMTQVCKTTRLARATYERWLERPPQSITKLDELDAELTRLEKLAAEKPAPQAA